MTARGPEKRSSKYRRARGTKGGDRKDPAPRRETPKAQTSARKGPGASRGRRANRSTVGSRSRVRSNTCRGSERSTSRSQGPIFMRLRRTGSTLRGSPRTRRRPLKMSQATQSRPERRLSRLRTPTSRSLRRPRIEGGCWPSRPGLTSTGLGEESIDGPKTTRWLRRTGRPP